MAGLDLHLVTEWEKLEFGDRAVVVDEKTKKQHEMVYLGINIGMEHGFVKEITVNSEDEKGKSVRAVEVVCIARWEEKPGKISVESYTNSSRRYLEGSGEFEIITGNLNAMNRGGEQE